MPSDCQCSGACDCGTTTVVKKIRIGNKEMLQMIKNLEKEIEKLKKENIGLREFKTTVIKAIKI